MQPCALHPRDPSRWGSPVPARRRVGGRLQERWTGDGRPVRRRRLPTAMRWARRERRRDAARARRMRGVEGDAR